MAIFAISLVKNEADIIAENLDSASRWADRIFVLDNGSSDGTWDTVQDLAKRNRAIVPFRQDRQPFRDSMRNDVFRAYRKLARRGDWWCILDADEFFADDPREFLGRVPRRYNAVWLADYNFRFTDADLAAHEQGARAFDGSQPWQEVLRHYVIDPYSEYRFFRHWQGLRSLPPRNWGPIYPERIRMRHYRYRSPAQIMTRLQARVPLTASGMFQHETPDYWPGAPAHSQDWGERVVASRGCLNMGEAGLIAPPPWQPPAIQTKPGILCFIGLRLERLRRRISRLGMASRALGLARTSAGKQ